MKAKMPFEVGSTFRLQPRGVQQEIREWALQQNASSRNNYMETTGGSWLPRMPA